MPGGYDLDTLPIRVDVCGGESAVSWLRWLSVRYDTPVRDLLKAAGARGAITQTSRVAGRLRNYPEIPQRLGLPADQVRLLVNPKPLPAATATYIDTFHRGEAPVRAQSRYCPHCLTGPDPFWPDHWQSPLSQICLTHCCYLLRSCPTCLQRPQGTPAWLTGPVELHRCPSRGPGSVNGGTRRILTWCDADLTTAPTVAAPVAEVRAEQLLHDWAGGAAETRHRLRSADHPPDRLPSPRRARRRRVGSRRRTPRPGHRPGPARPRPVRSPPGPRPT